MADVATAAMPGEKRRFRPHIPSRTNREVQHAYVYVCIDVFLCVFMEWCMCVFVSMSGERGSGVYVYLRV